MTQASLTKFTSTSTSINKSYPKAPRTNFYEGSYEVLTFDWENFGEILSNLKLNEVITQGTPAPGVPTKGTCPPFLRNKQNLSWNKASHDSNIILLDIDKVPADIAESQSLTDLLELVLTDLPELNDILSLTQTGVWGYASAGAFISSHGSEVDEPQQISGLSGAHFYFLLPADQDPADFRSYIRNRLLADQKGFVFENKLSITEARTYIDQKAIGQERLDFIAGTSCQPPYYQARPKPEFFEIEIACPAPPDFKQISARLAPAAKKYAYTLLTQYRAQPEFKARLQAVAEEQAKKISSRPSKQAAATALELLQNNVISGMVDLKFDDSSKNSAGIFTTPAWYCLLNPEEFDGMTLADPRDDQQRSNKAIFYARCPQKFIDASQDNTGLTLGAPAIFGFKGGEAVMQIRMDLASINFMMEGKTAEQMVEEYGPHWYKLIAEGNGLNPSEVELVLQSVKMRWNQSAKVSQKMVTAALLATTKKATNHSMREVLAEFDERFKLLKQGDIISAIWEEVNPLFPNATVIAEMPKQSFIDWHRKTVFDMDEKGKIKAVNAAQVWWERDHALKYSGVVFDPSTTEQTITHVKKMTGQSSTDYQPEHFYNMYRGVSKSATSPGERPCNGEYCDQKGCLHWFLNDPAGSAAMDCSKRSDPTAANAEWRTWGCGFTRRSKQNCRSSALWYYRSLFENICACRPSLFRWALDWISDLFQNPGDRPGTAFVMQGGQGVGKGLVVAPLGRLYSQHFYHAQSQREITGRFNLHLQNLILLYADEAQWGGAKSEAGAWKAFITEELKGIEGKGKNIYQVRNFVRMMISSNALWVTPTESDDRRHFILEASSRFHNDIVNGKGKFDDYWWKVSHISDEALLWDLLNRKITSVLRVAPATEGLIAQKMQSMTLEDNFIGWMLTDAKAMFDKPLGNSEIYSLLERSGIKFNAEYVQQKGFSQAISTKLIPECGEKVRNVGTKHERGLLLEYHKVAEWYSNRFEYEYVEGSE